ncbi:MAG: hypothetical protein D6726_08225, partial [Nitrospirae bacterium]
KYNKYVFSSLEISGYSQIENGSLCSNDGNTGGCFTVLEVLRKSGVSPEFYLPCSIRTGGITNVDISKTQGGVI